MHIHITECSLSSSPFSVFLFLSLSSWQKAEKKLMDGAFSELKAEETEAEVDEFGREMYKLFKVFNTKAKQMKKERDVGGGVSDNPFPSTCLPFYITDYMYMKHFAIM